MSGAYYTELLRDVDRRHNVARAALSDYPIFEDGYRAPLNRKILDHFWMREIGHETPDMFLHQLTVKMREIMPYYNQLYESTRLTFDPLSTLDLTSVSEGTTTDTSENVSTANQAASSDSSSRAVTSEFPQEMLRGTGNYATNATDSTGKTSSTGDTTSTATNTGEGKSSSTSRQSGRAGSAASVLMEYRRSLLNVDMNVIAELEPLFFQVLAPANVFSNDRIRRGYGMLPVSAYPFYF